tara:strand:- start:16143 stop:16301 length:159 start_codon:yes stop_codon:yes gene_type:complete
LKISARQQTGDDRASADDFTGVVEMRVTITIEQTATNTAGIDPQPGSSGKYV